MSNQTFLPEDYIAHKAERRTNIICVILFVVVMVAVFGVVLSLQGVFFDPGAAGWYGLAMSNGLGARIGF